MTFQEWSICLFKGQILGKLIPMQLKRTYPRFSIDEDMLCVSFVGFSTKIIETDIAISNPKYFLKVTYPQGKIQSFECLPLKATDYHISVPCDSAKIKHLTELCNKVLSLFDEKSSDLESKICEYNSLLDTLLDAEQSAVLKQYADLKLEEA